VLNKIACQSQADHPLTGYTNTLSFCLCDLDLDLVTLIYGLDLGILNVYLYSKSEHFRPRHSIFKSLNRMQTCFVAPVTLTVTRWPGYTDLS